MIFKVVFGECEHSGDLDRYLDDVRLSGGTILNSNINYISEVGVVELEVEYYDEWLEKFKKTESYLFSDYSYF